MRLAIDGGPPAVKDPLARYNKMGIEEADAAYGVVLSGPLSGYLGGERRGGYHVEALEERWREIFGVKHAVAVNSGTSGLLVACMAAGVERGTLVATTPYTMSATAAAPAFLGGHIHFGDIGDKDFCLSDCVPHDVVIITNLFGYPARLQAWREICDDSHSVLIEDNAQAFGAMEHGKYAGTIGHIGVFSGNVHKHLHCGEGGMCVTNDDALADLMRHARNHGELSGSGLGLNMRLNEVSAAIWLAQLKKHKEIVSERVEIAETLTEMVSDIPGLTPPHVRNGCVHTYYCWALKVRPSERQRFVEAMNAEGVPLKAGYVEPLYRLPAFKQDISLPVVEEVERSIVLYENCSYSPTMSQLAQFGVAFQKVIDGIRIPAWSPRRSTHLSSTVRSSIRDHDDGFSEQGL